MLQQYYPSFVGVSGFMSPGEVRLALKALPKNPERKLLVGVLANPDIISGNCVKYPQLYPETRKIAGIFQKDGRVINVLCIRGVRNSRLFKDLVLAMEVAGKNCDGVEICASSWPSKKDLEDFTMDTGAGTIILRIGSVAIQSACNCPELLAEKINEYDGCVDYVVIDRNGNGGRLLGIEFLERCFKALAARKLRIGFGIEGGVSAETWSAVEPLVLNFGVSTVAEAELKYENRGCLDPGRMIPYVAKASRFAGKHAA